MKGIRILIASLLGVTSVAMSTSSLAALALPSGWFIGADVGASRSNSANYGASMSSSGSGFGFDVLGGYKFLPYLAAEVGFNNYAKTSISSGGTRVGQDTHYSYYFAARGIMPIADSGFDLFAKLGLARLHSKVSATNQPFLAANGLSLRTGSKSVTGAYLGAGVDYNFSMNLSMELQWTRAKGNSSLGNYDLYSVGVAYLFE